MAKRYGNTISVNGKPVRRSHALWNQRNPQNKVKKGEVIHHKDENKKNDTPSNHKKMTDQAHKSLHSNAGIKALAKWRKENPLKAKKLSQQNAKKMHSVIKKRKK